MSKTLTIQSISKRANAYTEDAEKIYFHGDYVREMVEVLLASLVSGAHASFQSKPGWGKTDLLDLFAKASAGNDHYNMALIQPSTSATVITGGPDTKAIIEEGDYQSVVTDGTPFDESVEIFIIDEGSRANDTTFDAMLHALDPKKQDHCTVWLTNNWLPSGERVEALLDRITFFYWLHTPSIDPEELLASMMESAGKPEVPGFIISPKEAAIIRTAKPGPKAIAAITEAIQTVIELVQSDDTLEGFDNLGHPRFYAQWWKILYFNSVLWHGEEDFDKVHPKAMRLLRWAYGTDSYDKARQWENIVDQIADAKAADIERILAEAAPEFITVGKAKPEERSRLAGDLAIQSANWIDYLTTTYGDDDAEIRETIHTISTWASKASRGKWQEIK